jgi:menaquinone-9 beta-reductase
VRDVDVAVVGASVAGCTAARLFAQAGARVALVERRPDPAAHKVACTHAILPAATATIERLGLAPLLLERGALRTQAEAWSPYGGWLTLPDSLPDGWGVTRRTLDPLLRGLAAGTPGVELLLGLTARRVLFDGARVAGVEVEDRERRALAIRSRLLVAADGRESSVARLARVPGRVRPNARFFHFAYWRGVRPATTANRVWLLEPEAIAQFPNEDGLTVLVTGFHRARSAELRADLEGAYLRTLRSLPDAPELAGAERVSPILGRLDVPNVIRPAARPGIAFVGDAALAADPAWGVGLAFAFETAEWLVDATSGALDGGRALDDALRRYARAFVRRLAPHHLQIASFATGRRTRPLERHVFRRATTDPAVAHAFGAVLGRVRSPLALWDPRIVARLLVPRPPPGAAP